MLERYVKKILKSRVYDVAQETPLQVAHGLSERVGNKVLLKREDMQSVFSFKLRGSYNKMAQLTPEQAARGVITASAGNHAQGVALSAAALNMKAVVVMGRNTPDIKVNAVKRRGAKVEKARLQVHATHCCPFHCCYWVLLHVCRVRGRDVRSVDQSVQ